MRIKDGSTTVDHLNEFNILISKVVLIGVKVEDEDTSINLLCSLPNS